MIGMLFFGSVAERVGTRGLQAEFLAGMRVRQGALAQLQALYPVAFETICFVALNDEHLRDMSLPLADKSGVVFMARFPGG